MWSLWESYRTCTLTSGRASGLGYWLPLNCAELVIIHSEIGSLLLVTQLIPAEVNTIHLGLPELKWVWAPARVPDDSVRPVLGWFPLGSALSCGL